MTQGPQVSLGIMEEPDPQTDGLSSNPNTLAS